MVAATPALRDGVVQPAGAGSTDPANPTPGESRGFRTAFRLDAGQIWFVDQRNLPGELVEYPCADGGAVATAIRDMVVRVPRRSARRPPTAWP